MKGLLVGRHELLQAQSRALEDLGIEIVSRAEHIDRQKASQIEGVDAVVIQALPLSVLVEILPVLRGKGIKVLMMEQEAVGDLVPLDEAKKLVAEKPDRRTTLVALHAGEEKARVIEFKRMVEVLDVRIERRTLWEVEG